MKFRFKDADAVRGIHANGVSIPKIAKTFNLSEKCVRMIIERQPPYGPTPQEARDALKGES